MVDPTRTDGCWALGVFFLLFFFLACVSKVLSRKEGTF